MYPQPPDAESLAGVDLFLDPDAPDEEWGWVLDWLVQDLTDVERQSLSSLTARFDKVRDGYMTADPSRFAR